jgi:hypothetical protein
VGTLPHSPNMSSKQPVVTPRRTADEYSNAFGQTRRAVTAIEERPPQMTAYGRSGTSSHRGGQGFKSPQLHPGQRPVVD